MTSQPQRRVWRTFIHRWQNGCLPRNAALCAAAALAVLAIFIAAWHPSLAHADGGASARNQSATTAPDQTPVTPQAYAQQILHALADRRANNWVRYWQARADCDAAAAQDEHVAAPMDRVLLGLTGMLCARLEARLGVDPGDYLPQGGEERTVGLVASEAGAALGYTLFMRRWDNDVFLLDPLGRVAHAWQLDVSFNHPKLLDNGNLLADVGDSAIEFDPRGDIVWQYDSALVHHDFLKMPNGNVLLLVVGYKTREQAIAAGANPEFVHEDGIKYDYLIEVRPSGAIGGDVVWEWSVWDHLVQDFDPTKPNYGAIAEHPELIDINFTLRNASGLQDWTHINSVDYNPALDQIMLSPRHFSELWIIDGSTTTEEARGHSGGNSGMGGDLLYRWGNPRAYRHGTRSDQRLFWQHQTHWIAPGLPGAGNILVFNNGNEFSGSKRLYSSIDEIAPPVDGYQYRRDEYAAYPPDELAWTYAPEPRSDFYFYAPVISGTQRLPNGNTLVVDGTKGTIFQATRDGRIVWKYVVPLSGRLYLRQGERPQAQRTLQTPYGGVDRLANPVYRAYWYPPDHPGLQALDLTTDAYLIEDFHEIYDRLGNAAIAGAFGDPLADSDFDIYLDKDNRRLIYIKRPCSAEEARTRFFLSAIPADARDLPANRREHGFDNLDFKFNATAKIPADGCVTIASLPRYAVERIRTGQFTGEGQVWRADVELGE